MDTRLKQRLIGAAVLIALAVIFLPMLVQGPAPGSGVSDVPLDVPGEPGGAMETRDLPLVSPQAGAMMHSPQPARSKLSSVCRIRAPILISSANNALVRLSATNSTQAMNF